MPEQYFSFLYLLVHGDCLLTLYLIATLFCLRIAHFIKPAIDSVVFVHIYASVIG